MAGPKTVSRSTSLPLAVEARARDIALRENRSMANVIENAVSVFTLFPKDFRDKLIEAAADEENAGWRLAEISRRFQHQLAWTNFDASLGQLGESLPSEAVDDERLAWDLADIVEDETSR